MTSNVHIFIDTNVFLGFFETKPDSLAELKKLIDMANNGNITLWLPEQTKREFWRNREKSIKTHLKDFEQRDSLGAAPVLVREHEQFEVLSGLCRDADNLRRLISSSIKNEIDNQNTYADRIIRQLFEISKPIDTDEDEIFGGAHKRALCHIPPGKEDDIGDRLCWVGLLKSLPKESTCYVVSGDNDYKSEGFSENIRPYLEYEWRTKNGGTVKLLSRISQLVAELFIDAEKAIEEEKDSLAKELKESCSFAETHAIVANLIKYKGFSENQLRQIFDAIIDNTQVRWIRSDEDVADFYLSILEEYKGKIGSDYVDTLSELLKVRVEIFVDEIGCAKNNIDIDKYIEYLTRKLSEHYDVRVKKTRACFGTDYSNTYHVTSIVVTPLKEERRAEIEKRVYDEAKSFF